MAKDQVYVWAEVGQQALLEPAFLPRSQHGDRLWLEVDRPPTVLGFDVGELGLVRDLDQRSRDRQRRPFHIDVSPAKPENLSPPHARVDTTCGNGSTPSRNIRSSAVRRSPTVPLRCMQSRPLSPSLATHLDHTRPDRINALVEQPPPHLVERLGPPPPSPAGRPVWCHHALVIEAFLDRNEGELLFSPYGQRTVRARQEIALLIGPSTPTSKCPIPWNGPEPQSTPAGSSTWRIATCVPETRSIA